VRRSARIAAASIAALFLALHLPFLPTSLEDLDSINFALGVRQFDVAHHQPHPPGYPLYIVAAKGVHLLVRSEAHALSLLGIVAGALAVWALYGLFRDLDDDRTDPAFSWMAVVIVVLNPLFWLTASRPLSDMPGLAAALAVQVVTVRARRPRPLALAAGCAAFAAGIRSQVVWLTLPLLVWQAVRLRRSMRMADYLAVALSYAAGGLLWFVPLVIASGGPEAYWAALFNQGAEDLTGVKMLATTPTVRQLATALRYTLLEPWGYLALGGVAAALAAIGAFERLRASPRVFWILVLAFGPYAAFDLLFQESITTRYALPLVVPLAYLAVRGCALLPRSTGLVAAVALAFTAMYVDDVAIYQYSRMDAPAFRMLGDMAAARSAPDAPPFVPPVLAMHRREDFDMRRPITWAGDRMPPVARHLPAPPKHEWLELVHYWNSGGRAPVWYVADPLRSDLALVRANARPRIYRWPLRFAGLTGGVRPNIMDWYTMGQPDWYLGEGWALTPETAGIAREDSRGPGLAPITGWVRRWPQEVHLVVGGRNLGTSGRPAHVRIAIDGHVIDDTTIVPGFFLRMPSVAPLQGAGDYAVISIEADNRDLAVEQFDAQPAGRVVFGFGDGWHEQEYDPTTGAVWRWSSDKASIRLRGEGHALALTLRGEIEEAAVSHVTVRIGSRVLAHFDVGKTFTRTALLPADAFGPGEEVITIESSASYVPAETRWRSQDRRRLALKLYECSLTPVS
jgi:hypothetical protein